MNCKCWTFNVLLCKDFFFLFLHHQFNLIWGSVLASSDFSLLPIAVVGDRTVVITTKFSANHDWTNWRLVTLQGFWRSSKWGFLKSQGFTIIRECTFHAVISKAWCRLSVWNEALRQLFACSDPKVIIHLITGNYKVYMCHWNTVMFVKKRIYL
jgi:hypothetical protein